MTVTVTDSTNLSDSKSFAVTVADPAVGVTAVPVSALECKPFTGQAVATFTDPGGPEPNSSDPSGSIGNHYQATIDWGDTSDPDIGTIGLSGSTFTVTGSHTYAKEGTYTITTMIDHEGVITTVTGTATVKDNLALLVLDPSGKGALNVTGNGSVVVNGCGAIVVDSGNPEAAVITGNGSVTAADIDVTGGTRTTGHGSLSGPIDHEAPTPDPLDLPLPPASSTTYAAVNYSGSDPLTLSPGTYFGGIKITGQGAVTLAPGVYYMEGGGFSVTGQGAVTGNGVLIVNAPSRPGDTIRFTGQGGVTLTPLAVLTGPYVAYDGITIFQDPASSAPIDIAGQGGKGLAMTGTLYAPGATLSITGQGGVVASVNNDLAKPVGAFIVSDLNVTGNGKLTITVDDPPGASTASSSFSAQASATAIATHSADVGALVSDGGLTGPTMLRDPMVLDEMSAGLVVSAGGGDWLLNGKRDRKVSVLN